MVLVSKYLVARPWLADIPRKKHQFNTGAGRICILNLFLQLFSLGSKAQEKRGWPGFLLGFELVFVLVVVGSTLVLTVVVGRVVTLLVVVVVRCVVVLRGFAVVLTGGRALGLLVLIVFTGAGAFLGEAELVEFLGATHKPGKSEEQEVPSGHSEHA